MTTADATPFDPARPFRTRDGREGWDFAFTGFVAGTIGLQHWYPDGRYLFRGPDHPLDLVNLPDAPPAVEGERETDAAFVERLEKFAPMVGQPQLMQVLAAEWMRVVALARRAVASAESVAWHPDQDREWQQAKRIADVVLDRPNADPDDDIAVLARQLLRKAERIEAARYAPGGLEPIPLGGTTVEGGR